MEDKNNPETFVTVGPIRIENKEQVVQVANRLKAAGYRFIWLTESNVLRI
jgi:3-deoxy-D-arabino-heptulosonate 7-phosphate (DAHP) synthase